MEDAGYTKEETGTIRSEVEHYEKVREEVKLASGDYIDMKMYEPAMRHLLDTYIRAEDSEKVTSFDEMSLVDLLARDGEKAVDRLPEGIRKDRKAVAETIENNIRRVITDQLAVNPKYYERMSELLDALVKARKMEALKYERYLSKLVDLAKGLKTPEAELYPPSINAPAQRALYDNLDKDEALALEVDEAIRTTKKAGWQGRRIKEREVRLAIKRAIGEDTELVNAIFDIAKRQREY